MTTEAPPDQQAANVAAYLRANPGFLAEHPELYATLDPPLRVHGKIMADHMEAMLRAARAHAAEMEAKSDAILAAGRTAATMAERVQTAVVAMLHAPDPVEYVAESLPALLGVDAATLACEFPRPRWRTLPPGAIKSLLRNRTVVFRDQPPDAAILHAEAALLAERDILIHLPGERPALLALVSRDPAEIPAANGTQALAFLGRVLAALING